MLAHRTSLVALLLSLAAATAHAQDRIGTSLQNVEGERRREAAQAEQTESFIVGEWAFKRLTRAAEALEKGNHAKAIEAYDDMQARLDRLSPHEQSLMWQGLGYVYSAQEKYPQAAQAFAKALEVGALNPAALLDLRYNLAQLYFMLEKYPQAVEALEIWLSQAQNPAPEARYLLATGYMHLKKLRPAATQAELAVKGKGAKAPESWLQLLVSVYYDLNQKNDVIRVLQQLVARNPQKTYWLQLGSMYAETNQPARALATYELAHELGLLTTTNEVLQVAQLSLQQGIPLQAAKVLKAGMTSGAVPRNPKHVTVLAQSLVSAKEIEQALPLLEEVAPQGEDGDRFAELARVYAEREQWAKAAESGRKALAKGGLKRPGPLHILVGMALYYDGKLGPARAELEKALRYSDSAVQARQWLRLVSSRQGASNG